MNNEMERLGTILLKGLIVFIFLITVFFAVSYFFPVVINITEKLAIGFLPFILALIIAILIDPVVDWLERNKKINRGVAVAFTLLILLTVIGLIIFVAISRLMIELTALYAKLPQYTHYITEYGLLWVEEIRNYITNNPLPGEARNAISTNLQVIVNSLADIVTAGTNFVFGLVRGMPGFITIIIFSSLATFFISRDKASIAALMYRYTPKKFVRPTSMVIRDISTALVGFFRAYTILISITAFLTIIGLYFLKVEYAVTVGLIVGLLDLLPIVGPGAVMIPWAVYHLIAGNYHFAVGLFIVYGVTTGVRQFIEPKVLSQNIGLHPLATLLALYLGLKFIGVWGIIIGPFLVILSKAIIRSLSGVKF